MTCFREQSKEIGSVITEVPRGTACTDVLREVLRLTMRFIAIKVASSETRELQAFWPAGSPHPRRTFGYRLYAIARTRASEDQWIRTACWIGPLPATDQVGHVGAL